MHQNRNTASRADLAYADLIQNMEAALAAASSVALAQQALDNFGAVANACDDFHVRLLHLQLREKAGHASRTISEWEKLYQREPAHPVVARHFVIALKRSRRLDEALQVIETACQHDPDAPPSRDKLLKRAELLDDIDKNDEAFAIFRQLIGLFPADAKIAVTFAKRLNKVGYYADVVEVLEGVSEAFKEGTRAHALYRDALNKTECLRRIAPGRELRGEDCRLVALKLVLKSFENRTPRHGANTKKVAMITGGLGPGGAERQLTKLTRLMLATSEADQQVADDYEVLVRSHASGVDSKANDFFLKDLQDANVTVGQIDLMKPIRAERQVELSGDEIILYSMLPSPVHYGITRLAPYLRDNAFSVASVWQDGATLFGALAALFANVPQVQLVFRGLPPNIRTDRLRPEYKVLFQGLSRIPGVTFVTNSKVVAREYAKWLGFDEQDISILYNAVASCDVSSSDADRSLWKAFKDRTVDADFTVGGVFRLEPDKQPLRWIRLAAKLYAQQPNTRFVLVGDGRLRENVEQLAGQLGIADRLLLVGHSRNVGFWYDAMDVKVLLSRYEGLPNVLIEAQSLGVPVVSTPAGGASECFKEGVTGHILDCALNPDLDLACDHIRSILRQFREEPVRSELAKQFVEANFSEGRSVEVFASLLARMPTPANAHLTERQTA